MTFTLIDGGTGQELMRRWDRPATPLWSADVLAERPDLVAAVHADFLAAGADVITLASYSVTPARLARNGREADFAGLHAAAVEAAREARDATRPQARIAGCLPPLPGSYRPEERPDPEAAFEAYGRIVEAQAAGVDLFLCETLASVEELALAVRAGKAAGKPVWASATVDEADGTRLRSGEGLAEACRAALAEGADAVLVNCSPPEAVDAAMPVLADTGAPFGAYANGFTTTAPLKGDATVDALERRKDLGPEAYAGFARGWRDAGATILGGCCEVGPGHIAALRARLEADGRRLAPAPRRAA